MGKILALMCPGQGSAHIGMGEDLYQTSSYARTVYHFADDYLRGYLRQILPFEHSDLTLSSICFEGPRELLELPSIAPLAVFVTSIANLRLLEEIAEEVEWIVAGHSLGEYTALVASRVLTYQQALSLVLIRTRLMVHHASRINGAMVATLGLTEAQVAEICQKHQPTGVIVMANYNCPGQIVLSGDKLVLENACQDILRLGGKTRELNVGGPWHSPLMQPAADKFKPHLRRAKIASPTGTLYLSGTGRKVSAPATIRHHLRIQMVSPVLWEKTIRNMLRDGVTDFIELEPSRILRGFLKRIKS
ncbi:MAG: ACP S-malonyltransferase [bacterium]|nr:ACP S-malonyltransferase [bacterium]